MNVTIFIISVAFSIVGVAADDLTTKKFTSEIGLEYESSPLFRLVLDRWGYGLWLFIEAIVISFFGLLDSVILDLVIPDVLLFGVFWGTYRSLLAAGNLQIITMYKAIGIDAFKEHGRWLNEKLGKTPQKERRRMKLHYYICFLTCLIAYSSVLVVPFAASHEITSFLAFLSAALILGVAVFLLKIANTM